MPRLNILDISFGHSIPARANEGSPSVPASRPLLYAIAGFPANDDAKITIALDITTLPPGQQQVSFTLTGQAKPDGVIKFDPLQAARCTLDTTTPTQTFSVFFALSAQRRVGTIPVCITWLADFGAGYVQIAETSHVIFVIPLVPRTPWYVDAWPADSLNNPWTDMLDIACAWAEGTGDLPGALSGIVNNLFDTARVQATGGGGGPTFLYSADFANNYTDFTFYDRGANSLTYDQFHCSDFLRRLTARQGVRGAGINCQDCASAISVFGNLLGADLDQLTIGPSNPTATFPVRNVMPIGETQARSTEFLTHAVAAKMGASERETIVYDACVGFAPDYRPVSGMPLDEYLRLLTDPKAVKVDLVNGYRRREIVTPVIKQNF